jgi:nucleoside-diphosphate-sugar epimerase
MAEAFYRSFDTPVTIARPFNTYGPRQSARAVIPTIITQLLSGSTAVRLGSLSPTRDFTYVKDTVSGFLALAAADGVLGEEVNIASGEEHSIGAIATRLIAELNPEAKIVLADDRLRPEKSEVVRLVGDNRKIRQLTGWRPSYDIEAGLRDSIEWFRKPENLARYKSGLYNV